MQIGRNGSRQRGQKFSPAQPRPMEKILAALNHTSKKKREKRKIEKEELSGKRTLTYSVLKLNISHLHDCDAVSQTISAPLATKSPSKDGRYATNPVENGQMEVRKEFPDGKRKTESLLKRLKRTPELLSAYHKEIDQLAPKNFVRRQTRLQRTPHLFVPNHPVIRQDKNPEDSTGIRRGGKIEVWPKPQRCLGNRPEPKPRSELS
ncbi:hypothetical protein OUZ56_024529 [Daphnia magna]|uniref:Uncharacterized protein n=1 Tax=Daphnia magna TaxID=35525 RepID=A0ABR0B1I7_9CRUS|nr:hypothetical protein OUZ56_024529 [Daphnia magna]